MKEELLGGYPLRLIEGDLKEYSLEEEEDFPEKGLPAQISE
jgi:hypothetical protein